MKKNRFDKENSYHNDNVYNLRIITDCRKFKFNEKTIRLNNLNNFYDLLSEKIKHKNEKESTLQEYDIVFYIHGGGFLAQTTESVVGYLSE